MTEPTPLPVNPVAAQLIALLDHGLEESPEDFGTQNWHSLLWNLHNVRSEDWDTPPVPGSRTIREIVGHLGVVCLAYENHIFGDGTRSWSDPGCRDVDPGTDPAVTIAWLTYTHGVFRASAATLSDAQLTEVCAWGQPWTYGRIVEVVLQHTLYHTGEINYARAILQDNNDWFHMDLGRESEE